jgi:hypothetical protein
MADQPLTDRFYFPDRFDAWAQRPLVERLRIMAGFSSTLDRRFREYKRMGWVYVMRNGALKERVFKVGLSSRFPTERASELTRSTGVFGEFELVYFIHVGDRHAAESEAHRQLAEYRVTRSKEFFNAPLGTILNTLDDVSGRYPVWAGPKRSRKPLAQPFWLYRGPCPGCGATVSARELLIPVRAKCRHCAAPIPFVGHANG